MDKEIRSHIQRATQAARVLIEKDYSEQLEGVFDILPNGVIAPEAGEHLTDKQCVSRSKIVAAIEHIKSGGVSSSEAVDAYLREASFTTLNRFVALKMLEARGLVQECVSRGDQSAGFKEFTGLAPGLVQLHDHGYKLYLESIFDEIGIEVQALFDRRDPMSVLWLRRQAFNVFIELINSNELKSIWQEDETIGWVYQYFNSDEERREMRAQSRNSPRNANELAVRNQFFTPRYIVEFLVDNTLGKFWSKICGDDESFLKKCRYFIKNEELSFSEEGEEEAITSKVKDSIGEPGEAKDPREILVIDPACGSGHFLLYTFDLLQEIYIDAWNSNSKSLSHIKQALRRQFRSLEEYRIQIPKMIVENNVHGIDIDPRAAQIASLSLWMRAQKQWHLLGVSKTMRPRINKTNFVAAEKMPSGTSIMEDFSSSLAPPILKSFLEKLFEKMNLAHEAGSLLKIEEDIKTIVNDAQKEWDSYKRQQAFLPGMHKSDKLHNDSKYNFTSLKGEPFWDEAESLIISTLEEYSEQIKNDSSARMRMFAEDTIQGFSFIDLCRKKYDVILMNPPFGSITSSLKSWLRDEYPSAGENMSVATIQQSYRRLSPDGYIGVISDLPWIQQSDYESFREELINNKSLCLAIELGHGILGTDVEVAMSIFSKKPSQRVLFSDIHTVNNQEGFLAELSRHKEQVVFHKLEYFSAIDKKPFAYRISPHLFKPFIEKQGATDSLFFAAGGVAASDSDRVYRCWWEVDSAEIGKQKRWAFCQNGSPYSPGYHPTYFVIRADRGTFKTITSYPNARTPNSDKYWTPGLSYGKRTWEMYSYPMPKNQVITWEGQALFPVYFDDVWSLLAISNSSLYSELSNLVAGQHKYAGYLNTICTNLKVSSEFGELAQNLYRKIRLIDCCNELSHYFCLSYLLEGYFSNTVIDIISRSESTAVQLLDAIDNEAAQCSGWKQAKPRKAPSGGSYFSAIIGSPCTPSSLAPLVVSAIVGVLFGRWDLRKKDSVNNSDPCTTAFEALPSCPNAMLLDKSELSAKSFSQIVVLEENGEGDTDYPVRIAWDGILVDDPGYDGVGYHQDDIVRHVRSVLSVLEPELSYEQEKKLCNDLSVAELRDYFRSKSGFWSDHIKMYSRSRRKAPIYWAMSTSSLSYSVWIYYPTVCKDTLYVVLEKYIRPKLQQEERELTNLIQSVGRDATSSQRAEISSRETLVDELKTLIDEVSLIAALWNPILDDGVVINSALLWRVMVLNKPWQKVCKKAWDSLVNGNYDWSHLAMHLWPDRVVPKCHKDHSLAIAHNLEGLLWYEDDDGKWHPKDLDSSEIGSLINDRTSPAVKLALDNLLYAPAPAASRKSARPKSTPSRRTSASTGAQIDSSLIDAVKTVIAATSDGVSKADVVSATGISNSQWTKVIAFLLTQGLVKQTGERRGARYHIV